MAMTHANAARRQAVVEREALIVRLHAEGKSDHQIAGAAKCHRRSVYEVRKRLGLPINEDPVPVAPRMAGTVRVRRRNGGEPPIVPHAPKPGPLHSTIEVDRGGGAYGLRAPDGQWWTGHARADRMPHKAGERRPAEPLLTPYADYARRLEDRAEAARLLKRAGISDCSLRYCLLSEGDQ